MVVYPEERTRNNVDGSLRKGDERYSYEEYADMTQKSAAWKAKEIRGIFMETLFYSQDIFGRYSNLFICLPSMITKVAPFIVQIPFD